jgi:hypothetical protein
VTGPRRTETVEPIVSVELLVDADAEAAIRRDWEALAAAGTSSAGSHPGVTNRPHLSLAVRRRTGDPERLACDLEATIDALPPRLALAGLVLFPHGDRVVLARAVVPTPELLRLHAAVAEAVSGWGDPLPHSAPGDWTPHVTLARRLRRDQLPIALDVIDADPIDARPAGLRVWDAAERRVHEVRRV